LVLSFPVLYLDPITIIIIITYFRTYVGAKWWGFSDPQSGISHYSWWIGTTPGGDNLMKEERLHHSEMAYRFKLPGGVQLPLDKTIYTTVRATNHVGEWYLQKKTMDFNCTSQSSMKGFQPFLFGLNAVYYLIKV
jgi:hypothetical protein